MHYPRPSLNRTLVFSWVLGLLVSACSLAANVDLTLFNTEALLDVGGSPNLQGNASSGDLVQLIHAGANTTIDVPNGDGSPGGDDYLLGSGNNPTHVGVNVAGSNTGKLAQPGIIYSDTLVGDSVYVRFWNDSAVATATYYGNSKLLTLPSADAFGQADLDFVPLTSDPRTTDQAFSAIPTLTEWGLILLFTFVAVLGVLHQRRMESASKVEGPTSQVF